MPTIYIKDFTEYPGLRHCSLSDDSGEEYYHKILNNAFKNAYESKQTLTVNIDQTAGYAPSFLDEAFGNLVFDFGLDVVTKHIEIISEQEPDLKDLILNETFVQWEERRTNKDKPETTAKHKDWFRLENGIIEKTNL